MTKQGCSDVWVDGDFVIVDGVRVSMEEWLKQRRTSPNSLVAKRFFMAGTHLAAPSGRQSLGELV